MVDVAGGSVANGRRKRGNLKLDVKRYSDGTL